MSYILQCINVLYSSLTENVFLSRAFFVVEKFFSIKQKLLLTEVQGSVLVRKVDVVSATALGMRVRKRTSINHKKGAEIWSLYQS